MRFIRLVLILSLVEGSTLVSLPAPAAAVQLCGALAAATVTPSVVLHTDMVSSGEMNLVKQGHYIYKTKIKPARNPTAAFKRLSSHDKKAVKAFEKKHHTSVSSGSCSQSISGINGDSCTANAIAIQATNALNMPLYEYSQEISFCYDHSSVVSHTYRQSGETHMIFWQFQNLIDQQSGGDGQWQYRSFGEGQFQICIMANLGCFESFDVWIDMIAQGDGQMFTSTSED